MQAQARQNIRGRLGFVQTILIGSYLNPIPTKATSVRGITLTAMHLGSFLNFAQLACTANLQIEPKCAAVKVMPLNVVVLEGKILPTI